MKQILRDNRSVIGLAALAVGAIVVGAIGAIVWWTVIRDSGETEEVDTSTTQTIEEETPVEES